ncbi:MAG: xylose isomerase, partial [Opitutaceae bacterium]
WSMIGYPSSQRPWNSSRQLRAMRRAGFAGIYTEATPAIAREARRLGLVLTGGLAALDLVTGRKLLRSQARAGANLINVHLLRHDTPPATAARAAARLVKFGRSLGVTVQFETHRDTATETPEKFSELARLYRSATGEDLPVTWDHSHFAVVKHLQPPDYARRLLAWPRLIQASPMFHLRPFTGQHCQAPVTDARGRLTPEFRIYLGFVEQLFACWLAGPRPGNALHVVPEMGMTHGYQLSTARHAWPESIRAAREIRGVWNRVLTRSAGRS